MEEIIKDPRNQELCDFHIRFDEDQEAVDFVREVGAFLSSYSDEKEWYDSFEEFVKKQQTDPRVTFFNLNINYEG